MCIGEGWPALLRTRERVTQPWELRLYLAGRRPRSQTAFENLQKICNTRLKGRHTIEVIDVEARPELARADDIIAAPTLVRVSPLPMKRILGDLSTGSERSKSWLWFWGRSRGGMRGQRLLELEETMRAIRGGEVDALVVESGGGDRTLTFGGA